MKFKAKLEDHNNKLQRKEGHKRKYIKNISIDDRFCLSQKFTRIIVYTLSSYTELFVSINLFLYN